MINNKHVSIVIIVLLLKESLLPQFFSRQKCYFNSSNVKYIATDVTLAMNL